MKKRLLHILCFSACLLFTNVIFGQRYVSEIFTDDTVTHNVVYGQNISVLTAPTLTTVDLKADVYEPKGDVLQNRATVFMIHTGSFLPIFYNGQATGIKTDTVIVEMCHQFARRGYTAIALDYRLGWNPQALGAAGQDIRTGTLLLAVYRALQDVKACVRYFRNDALTANTYHIDEQNLILGGAGSGGYVAFAYATLNDPDQIDLPKFIASTTNAGYGFTAGMSYVNMGLWGDFDGYGGTTGYNIPTNTPGVSNAVSFIFNMGGALGDSSWLQTGVTVPVVAFHVVNDPFAPYKDGPVIVPTTGDFVVDVSGSWRAVRIADSIGDNNCFKNNSFSDPYTVRANSINDGYEGLFPFEMSDPPGPATGQAGPWDYIDSTTVYTTCMFGLGFTQGHTDTIWYNSLATHPDNSLASSHAYIDTIMNYLNPRINLCLHTVGIDEVSALRQSLSVFPNPASSMLSIKMNDATSPIRYFHLYDFSGRLIRTIDKLNSLSSEIDVRSLSPGCYTLKTGFDSGEVSQKVILQ